ncbi:MAG TPA: hypothetical protein VK171_12930 [Fimbriimonas sp.]|nr:hypothetical protein [Fimbriimonas sp.]
MFALAVFVGLNLASEDSYESETKELFLWYESLGVSHMLQKPFVSVEGERSDHRVNFGFLVSTTKNWYTLLTPSLSLVQVSRKYTLKPKDLKSTLISQISDSDTRLPSFWDEAYFGTVGWLCHKSGLQVESNELMKQMFKSVSEPSWGENKVEAAKLASVIFTIHHLVVDIIEEKKGWKELEKQFEAAKKRYRNHPRIGEFDILVEGAKTNARDEAKLKRISVSSSSKIEDLIFWLAHEKKDPGTWKLPVQKILHSKKLEAVPQLIQALDDERFAFGDQSPIVTTGVFGPCATDHILRVKDKAAQVLGQLSGRTYYRATDQVKKEFTEWYKNGINSRY